MSDRAMSNRIDIAMSIRFHSFDPVLIRIDISLSIRIDRVDSDRHKYVDLDQKLCKSMFDNILFHII